MYRHSRVSLTKALRRYDWFLEQYEALNPEWSTSTLMQFLADAFGSVQTYLARGDYGPTATRIATTLHLEIGKPGDKPGSVHLWRCEDSETCCEEHLYRQLVKLFYRQKLNAMLRQYVGPAIIWHQGTTETIFLPDEFRAEMEQLSPKRKAATAKHLLQAHVFPLDVDLGPLGARGRSVVLEGRVGIHPVIADANDDVAYFPIDVAVRLVGLKPSAEAHELLSSLLLLARQSFTEIAAPECLPKSHAVDTGGALPQSPAITSVGYEKSADFRQWKLWFPDGTVREWTLTRQQIPLVKAMWTFLHTETPCRYVDDILNQAQVAGYSRSRWHDKWRSRPDVLGSLVIGRDGYYGLNIAPDEESD